MSETNEITKYKFDKKTFQRCLNAAKFEINVQLNSCAGEKNTPYVEGYFNIERIVKIILREAAR